MYSTSTTATTTTRRRREREHSTHPSERADDNKDRQAEGHGAHHQRFPRNTRLAARRVLLALSACAPTTVPYTGKVCLPTEPATATTHAGNLPRDPQRGGSPDHTDTPDADTRQLRVSEPPTWTSGSRHA